MKSVHLVLASALAATVLACAAPALAVIRVDNTVSKIYADSKAVVVGTVTAVNPDNRVADVKVTDAAKGESPGEKVRVQIVSPEDLIAKVAAGQPAVLFVAEERGNAVALVHLADTWLMAQRVPESKPPVFRVVQVFDAKQTFPGRTVALARMAGELKTGPSTLLNKVEPNFFRGAIKEVAKLGVARPTLLAAADVNGDKKPDLVVAAADGAHLFLAAGAGYEDATATWGLAGAPGLVAAFGDASGHGKPDLLLGKEIYINDGRKFTPAKALLQVPDSAKPLAAALADVTGDKKPDALFLLAGGTVLIFENPGAPGQPWSQKSPVALWQEKEAALAAAFGDWGDNGRPHVLAVRPGGIVRYALDADGGPPAGFERLTGEKTPLVNRGFGAFLAALDGGSALVAAPDRPVPFKLSPATPVAAADLHGDAIDDLLILAPDGRLFEADNHAKASP
ncbi:MAG: VCBS repeat-containing protein [Planctomycetota bacterium]|nr:VCBS repeat-containing protein [Planctomycetota bacterium]